MNLRFWITLPLLIGIGCFIYNHNPVLQKTNMEMKNFMSRFTPYRPNAYHNLISPLCSDCILKKLVMITQHGISYPNLPVDLLNDIKNKIVQEKTLDRRIRNPFRARTDSGYGKKGLAEEGKNEIYQLGERTMKRFPSLFGASDSKYEFLSDTNENCRESRRAFLDAVLTKNGIPVVSDDATLPTECNEMIESEQDSLRALEPFKEEFFDALRLILPIQFTAEEYQLIYEAYAYETAWKPNAISIWAVALSVDFVKKMDYFTDLLRYYQDGYYTRGNYKPLCFYLQQIVQFFDDKETDSIGKFYFTNNSVFVKFLSLLQLYYNKEKDFVPVSIGGYKSPREWKLSKIGGFASNLLFILYELNQVEHVALFHQEKIIPIGKYGKRCMFSQFKELYGDALRCTKEDVC